MSGNAAAAMLGGLSGKLSEMAPLASLLGVETSGELFVAILQSETVENHLDEKWLC
jgi:hypothetical protein